MAKRKGRDARQRERRFDDRQPERSPPERLTPPIPFSQGRPT
jgi:hypothetical protein